MTIQTGITTETTERFIVDAGAVYIGFVDFSDKGTLIGATRGGSTLAIEQDVIELPVDGAHGPVKGCRRIVGVRASLTVNLIEHTLNNLKRALVGSESAAFNLLWDAVTRSAQVSDSDYLDNITIVGQVSGNSSGTAIQLKNVIIDSNFELSFTDKEEGVLAVTFSAHFDASDLSAEPWSVFWPKWFEIFGLKDADSADLYDADSARLQVREEIT